MSSERDPTDRAAAEVSQAWAQTQSAQPPAAVDDAVLKFARAAQPGARQRRRWQAPLALAAVLVLGVGVMLQLWREPQVSAPLPAPTPAPAEVADAQRDAVSEAEARRRAESESQREDAAARKQIRREAVDRARAPARPPASPPPPAEEPMAAAVMPSSPAPTTSQYGFAPQARSAESVQPRIASSSDIPRSMVLAKRAAMDAWQAADFQELPLAVATREQVHARYGEPASTAADGADRYQQLPGLEAAAEFFYDERARLSRVRLLPEPAPTMSQWFERTVRFDEQPQIADSSWSCDGGSSTTQNVSVWVYPSRGVWFVVDAQQRVLEVNYAAHCD